MLEQIFLKVMDMSWSASMIIAIVIIVRILLKRFPKFISYMLWSVVLFRLLCPVTLEIGISPIPNLEPTFHAYISEINATPIEGLLGEPAIPYTGGEIESPSKARQIMSVQPSPDKNVKSTNISWRMLFISLGKYMWISGVGILFLYCIISFMRIRNRVSPSIPFKENIYITDESISPFVMGIFHPRIYLPEGLNEEERTYIIFHEKYHIRRFDHIVKPIAFTALCIHWFNPLAWIAFTLFCKDMEMSCDEAVIKGMGEKIRADYSISLLTLSTKQRILRGIPVDFGEGNTKGRIKNLATFKNTKKGVLAILIPGVVILILCLASTHKNALADNKMEDEMPVIEKNADENLEIAERLHVSLDMKELYHTSAGDPSNLYYIDENSILWGSGRNEYGQLGQGTQDYEFYNDMVKIAENVVDVDYSQKGFVIFLTEDHKLYGVGNAGCGALRQYAAFDGTRYVNGDHYYVSEPCLLMENVKYARCGRDDIVCLTEDGAVWIWGTICTAGGFSPNAYYLKDPQKILENAVLVTGGWFNHAALLQDGTVWTWGYNSAGNCGVADLAVVSEPTMVAENVVMVWTDLAVANYPQPDVKAIAMAWTGRTKYNTEYQNIAEFDGIYPRLLNNTVIQKADGSYWVCGENVGKEEKVVHGAESDYSVICTDQFYPCE